MLVISFFILKLLARLLYSVQLLLLIFFMIWWVSFDVSYPFCLYPRIYLAVQRLRKNQIHVLQVQQATEDKEIINLANIVKFAFGIFYVFLLFLFCSLPLFICVAVYYFRSTAQAFHCKRFSFSRRLPYFLIPL